jgi:DnaJ like chaperone protein
MFWFGKLLGAIFGHMVAGPIGAVLGLLLGHYFDISIKSHWLFIPPPKQHTQTQDIFFRATFLIMGYIAKSDGRVSENEIRVASHIMQNMMLSNELKLQAIRYFNQGKLANFVLDQTLSALYNACYQQRNLLQLFLEIQLQAAYADRVLILQKQRILEHICYQLGLDASDFFFQRAYSYQQSRQRTNQQPKIDPLENAYRTLSASTSTNNVDLKKTYRKLMSQNHPDKLVSKGLPEEMIKLATQKTQEIKSAYELICKARGI